MKRITGTHIYGYLKCPRAVALDLHLDRSERRLPHPWEEFSAARGRDFEARYVAGLDFAEPEYPERDWVAGAAATLALLRSGAGFVYQGVLLDDDRLGIPDLLRRVPGASALGAHHYEVVDVKTSGRARSDQILQVVFYSRLLGALQGRMPEHAALVLKDGAEHRFLVADYLAAYGEVEAAVLALREDVDSARPFFAMACESCHWNHRCVPAMEASGDLSLLHGMSPGARSVLEGVGVHSVAELEHFAADGARSRGNLDPTLLRRLRKAAQARAAGHAVAERRPQSQALEPAAVVHLLTDPYADRVLWFGVQYPATAEGAIGSVCPLDQKSEWPAFRRLLAEVPASAHLLHYGHALPRWYEQQAFLRESELGISARFCDLARRLHGSALFPGQVHTFADCVRHGLGRDPYRFGHPGECAMWLGAPDCEHRLAAKGQGDLQDLQALFAAFLSVEVKRAQEAELGSQS